MCFMLKKTLPLTICSRSTRPTPRDGNPVFPSIAKYPLGGNTVLNVNTAIEEEKKKTLHPSLVLSLSRIEVRKRESLAPRDSSKNKQTNKQSDAQTLDANVSISFQSRERLSQRPPFISYTANTWQP